MSINQGVMPTLFVSHGAPDILIRDEVAAKHLGEIPDHFPKPRAIVVVSAHWIDEPVGIGAAAAPATIHDFGGFDPRLYDMRYPAPGDPELARRIAPLLADAGIPQQLHPGRGLDHGVWIPLTLMYPDADIPVVTVSLPAGDLQSVAQLGAALGPLRREGVLIAGSGGSVHNLRFIDPSGNTQTWVEEFEEWLRDTIENNRFSDLISAKRLPANFRLAHPSLEHFAPLVLTWAAAGGKRAGRRLALAYSYANIGMSHYLFDG